MPPPLLLMPSWDRIYLLETVDEYVISELRLSETDMIFAVLGVLLIFALVFPFLFAAIAIYGNQGSATVIVQTIIIGSTGLFANIKGTISERLKEGKGDKYLDDVLELALESL